MCMADARQCGEPSAGGPWQRQVPWRKRRGGPDPAHNFDTRPISPPAPRAAPSKGAKEARADTQMGEDDAPMAISDNVADVGEPSAAHFEMMALLQECKNDTKQDIMQHVESVIEKRVTKLFSQVASRMDKMDARATRVESSVDALATAQKALVDNIADVSRKLAALTMSFAAGGNHPSVGSSSASASAASPSPAAPRQAFKRDSSDAILLFFWPVTLTRSFAKTMVAKVLDERATEAARKDVVVTAPPAGTACGLQFTSRLHADAPLDSLRGSPLELSFPDGTASSLRADYAKPERQRQRGRAFTPVFKAILDLGFAKSQIIQKHTDNPDSTTTTVYLDNGGTATSVGVFTFIIKDTSAKIINFVPGDVCRE